MTVESQLINQIKTSGSGVGIYNLKMPDKNRVFPLIVYQRVTSPVSYTVDAVYNHSDIQFQFTCWGESAIDAKALAQKVFTSLSMFKTDPIWRTYIDGRLDRYETETGLCSVIVEVTCRAEEF